MAHVHDEPSDGILFKSVQRAGGTNVVLFGAQREFGESPAATKFLAESFKLFSTKEIKYKHKERRLYIDKGKVSLAYDEEDDLLEEE